MENSQRLLQGANDMEKGAYLGAIASIATADREASPEEIEYLSALADNAGLSSEQKQAVIKSASEISDSDVMQCLDIIKKSDLKFSLVTDIIAFAKSDNNYSEREQSSVKKMANYLGVNQEQFSLLDHFTEKVKASELENAGSVEENNLQSVESRPTDLLSSFGLKDKFQNAGINGGSILKGILGLAAPLILTKMVTGGLGRGNSGGGMFGNSMGGMLGGGGMFGNSMGGMLGGGLGGMLGGGGGLGSVFSMLNGGRGFGNSGGFLSRILGGGF